MTAATTRARVCSRAKASPAPPPREKALETPAVVREAASASSSLTSISITKSQLHFWPGRLKPSATRRTRGSSSRWARVIFITRCKSQAIPKMTANWSAALTTSKT